MRKKTEGPRFTERGKDLYRRFVETLLEEMQEKDFIRTYLQGEPSAEGTCFKCGCWEPLIQGTFCLVCTKASWEK